MRHQISWTDLVGQRVGVWGLGVEGHTNVRKLRSLGIEPVVVDDRPPLEDPLVSSVVATGEGGLEALSLCDVVVKTPGISRQGAQVERLEASGIAVVGGLGLWLADAPIDRVVCITGTKGKSTTTAVAAHLAKKLGLHVFAGGNLGVPPFDPDLPLDFDFWFIETSSYQAADIAVTPPVVAVTSLGPDHLPWHGGVESYYRDKLSLCSQPGARVTVASSESEELVAHADLLGPSVRWVSKSTWPEQWMEPLGLVGSHNRVNAGIARTCLVELGIDRALDDEVMKTAADGFGGLDSRLQLVARVGGVDYYDDSLSTNVLPTMAAVDTFRTRRIALIAGGLDRGIDYAPLAAGLARRVEPTLVLTCYQTGPVIQREIDALESDVVTAEQANDLAAAVARAAEWAEPDGVVLLSPAAASFDAFDDYKHRARVFREAIPQT